MKQYKVVLKIVRKVTEERIQSVEANDLKEAEHKVISKFRKYMERNAKYDDVINLSVASQNNKVYEKQDTQGSQDNQADTSLFLNKQGS